VLPAFVAGLADVVSKRLMQQGLLPGTTGKTSATAASTGKWTNGHTTTQEKTL
jgi:hypothetical protein